MTDAADRVELVRDGERPDVVELRDVELDRRPGRACSAASRTRRASQLLSFESGGVRQADAVLPLDAGSWRRRATAAMAAARFVRAAPAAQANPAPASTATRDDEHRREAGGDSQRAEAGQQLEEQAVRRARPGPHRPATRRARRSRGRLPRGALRPRTADRDDADRREREHDEAVEQLELASADREQAPPGPGAARRRGSNQPRPALNPS